MLLSTACRPVSHLLTVYDKMIFNRLDLCGFSLTRDLGLAGGSYSMT